MWFMPRAARERRGGDSGWAFTRRHRSRMLETRPEEEIRRPIAERLADPDAASSPDFGHVLHCPIHRESRFDIVLNPLDGP